MKKCPPGVSKCGGNWIQRQVLRFDSGGSPEPSLGYGLLYNWYAATDARGVAPSGFRVPSISDYNTLLGNFANSTLAGVALRSDRNEPTNNPSWNEFNDGDNSSGFTAFPAGVRISLGSYQSLKSFFESQSTSDIGPALGSFLRILKSESQDFTGTSGISRNRGCSVRCVSDSKPSTVLVQDNDGNNYSWVQIGSQYWLQQSLKTTTYNNGDAIPTGLNNTEWANTTDGAWAYPNGDPNLPI